MGGFGEVGRGKEAAVSLEIIIVRPRPDAAPLAVFQINR